MRGCGRRKGVCQGVQAAAPAKIPMHHAVVIRVAAIHVAGIPAAANRALAIHAAGIRAVATRAVATRVAAIRVAVTRAVVIARGGDRVVCPGARKLQLHQRPSGLQPFLFERSGQAGESGRPSVRGDRLRKDVFLSLCLRGRRLVQLFGAHLPRGERGREGSARRLTPRFGLAALGLAPIVQSGGPHGRTTRCTIECECLPQTSPAGRRGQSNPAWLLARGPQG